MSNIAEIKERIERTGRGSKLAQLAANAAWEAQCVAYRCDALDAESLGVICAAYLHARAMEAHANAEFADAIAAERAYLTANAVPA